MKTDLDFIIQLAKKTGEILMEHFNPLGTAAELKSDNTVVTQADLDADEYIAQAIHKAYPQDLILSEEANTQISSIDQAIWIVDPLDGTTNFSLGLPIWGISIARLIDGQPQTAALNFPILGELYTAQRGQGATLNGSPIQARQDTTTPPTAFFTCCTRTHKKYKVTIPFKTRILGSAAYNMVSIARGSSVIAFESTPKIWDIAAVWLITQEAGGLTNVFSGPAPFPLTPDTVYTSLSYPTMMAATPEMQELAQKNIQPQL